MSEHATLQVSPGVRDEVLAVAEREGLTVDAAVALLLRRERQRRLGDALSTWEPNEVEGQIMDASARDAATG